MGCLVAKAADLMEGLVDVAVESQPVVNFTQQVELAGLLVSFNTDARRNVPRDRLAKLTQFDQGGVWIGNKRTLCRHCQLQKQWIVSLQISEV